MLSRKNKEDYLELKRLHERKRKNEDKYGKLFSSDLKKQTFRHVVKEFRWEILSDSEDFLKLYSDFHRSSRKNRELIRKDVFVDIKLIGNLSEQEGIFFPRRKQRSFEEADFLEFFRFIKVSTNTIFHGHYRKHFNSEVQRALGSTPARLKLPIYPWESIRETCVRIRRILGFLYGSGDSPFQ